MIFYNKTEGLREKRKNSYVIPAIVLIMFFSLAYVSALTASLGNARMIIRAKTGETIDKYILVKNVNNETVDITMYAEGDLANFITIKEPDFTLQPGEDKKAEFTIKVAKNGTTETKINVRFSPEGKKSGVGLSSTIDVIAEEGDGTFSDDGTGDGSVIGKTISLAGKGIYDENGNISVVKIAISTTTILVVIFIILMIILSIKKSSAKKEKGFSE